MLTALSIRDVVLIERLDLAFDQGQYLTALKLAEEAAKRGEPQANTLIGRLYAEGLGVQKDNKLAYDYYMKASQLGDVQGTLSAAVALAEGRGVKKDRKVAAELFEKAALTGNAEANYNLGLLFQGRRQTAKSDPRLSTHPLCR